MVLRDNQLGDNANESLLEPLSVNTLNIHIDNNQYTYFPGFSSNLLNSMNRLSMSGNDIAGVQPDHLESLKEINEIKINDNSMTEMPYMFLSGSAYLDLQHNRITGLDALKMNQALCKNYNFRDINLSYNKIGSLHQFPNLQHSLCQDNAVNHRESLLSQSASYITSLTIKGVILI